MTDSPTPNTTVRVEVPPEEQETVSADGARFPCTQCSFSADKPADLAEHRKRAHAVDTSARPATPRPKRPVPANTTPKAFRVTQWEKYLYEDLNPLLVRGTSAFCGIPPEWLELSPPDEAVAAGAKGFAGLVPVSLPGAPMPIPMPVWNPRLKEQLALSKKQAHSLAKAAAEFVDTPMGKVLLAWIEANQFWFAIGSALLTAGAYGWHVMKIRTEVMAVQEQLRGFAEQMAQNPPQGAPTENVA